MATHAKLRDAIFNKLLQHDIVTDDNADLVMDILNEVLCTKKANKVVSAPDRPERTEPPEKTCRYIYSRGEKKGMFCTVKPKDDCEFCTPHARTNQALEYEANDSPLAKKAAALFIERQRELAAAANSKSK